LVLPVLPARSGQLRSRIQQPTSTQTWPACASTASAPP
jgi:hypothetical protein